MADYLLTREAADDLVDIWKYIARDDIDAADRVEAAIYRACLIGRSNAASRTTTQALDKASSQVLDGHALSKLRTRAFSSSRTRRALRHARPISCHPHPKHISKNRQIPKEHHKMNPIWMLTQL